jgi:hypothetical protein
MKSCANKMAVRIAANAVLLWINYYPNSN